LSASRSERVKSFCMEGFGTVKIQASGIAICLPTTPRDRSPKRGSAGAVRRASG
jgi:hypothetical protein